jgi:hypothetical protein
MDAGFVYVWPPADSGDTVAVNIKVLVVPARSEPASQTIRVPVAQLASAMIEAEPCVGVPSVTPPSPAGTQSITCESKLVGRPAVFPAVRVYVTTCPE